MQRCMHYSLSVVLQDGYFVTEVDFCLVAVVLFLYRHAEPRFDPLPNVK